MILTTLHSVNVFLVNDQWDGVGPFAADFSIVRDNQASLTRRESRRAFSMTLLASRVEYQATVSGADLRALQGSLRALNTQPVILPFWPAVVAWADRATAPISGGLRIAFKADWSQYSIYLSTDAEPGWPAADDNFAPCLMGFLTPTDPQMFNPDAAAWPVKFTESGPVAYALTPATASFTAGPNPSGYTVAPALLPFQPDFSRVTEQISVDVRRKQVGFARQQGQTFYPQLPARSQTADYTLDSADAGKFLYFLQSVAASGQPFWASSWLEFSSLTQDTLVGDTVLNVQDTSALQVGDYISVFAESAITRKVTALTVNTITIDSAIGAALTATETCVFQLCLASADKATVTVSWESVELALATLQWMEAASEYVPAGNETIAVTLGTLAQRIILFQFTRDLGNGTVLNYYFTSYEADVAYGGHTYATQNIECGEITQALNLEDDGTDVTTYLFAGNPLIADITKQAEAPLTATITFADYDGATVSNAEIVFTGDASATSRQGNVIKAKCKFGPSVLESQLPPMIRGTICNHLKGTNADGSFLISAGCTLLKADWKFTGLVTAPLSAAFPFALHVGTLTGVGTNAAASIAVSGAIFKDFFANGWIEWGAGAAIQRRGVIGSTLLAGGGVILTLHRYFNGVPNIGDTVTIYPGCDGVFTTCKAFDAGTNPTGKFDNYLNFGAEPFTPIANPSTTGIPNVPVQGGKK
ncbi:MAG TPA: phage BR0599 family protein [Verrucomicrobiae bacterium]|nr:phage BR0599 family protein [Verrucomicrobiae bacterium]